jgi:predicted acyl esterase
MFMCSSVKDTNFIVKLVDLHPNDKRTVKIVDSGIRTRFRDCNFKAPTFIEPYIVIKYEFSLGSSASYLSKDHKLRLEISSSNFPRFNVNSNVAGEETNAGFKIAIQEVDHSKIYPSHLILPIYKKE